MAGAVFPSCSLAWGQTIVGVMAVMVTTSEGLMPACWGSQDYCSHCPRLHGRPLLTHTSTENSWTLTGKSVSVSFGVTAPFSWVLVHTKFCLCPPTSLCPQFCGGCLIKFHWSSKSDSLGVLSPFARSPGWEIFCGSWKFCNSARTSLV